MNTNLLLTIAMLITGPAATAMEWPADMPKVRFTVNPLFDQQGYRFGYIPNIETTYGWKQEGKMSMGYSSGETPIYDDLCLQEGRATANAHRDINKRRQMMDEVHRDCQIDENPWPFSMVDKDLYNELNGRPGEPNRFKGLPVIAYYMRESWGPFGPLTTGAMASLWADTSKFVKKLWPVDPNLNVPRFFSLQGGESTVPEDLNPNQGYIQGTIVKATLDHVFRKTFEITIQEGIGNSTFRRFSVDNADMYDHLVMAMRTGDQLKVGYTGLFTLEGSIRSLRGYTTYYRINSVERIPENNGLGTLPARNRGFSQ